MLVLLAEPAVTVLDRVADVGSVLTPEEWQRARRFRRPNDREAFIAAHVAVRLCVAALTAGSASAIVIEQRCERCGGAHGRPSVMGAPGMDVSWSHSGGWVAAVATYHGPVGIDIQVEPPGRGNDIVWSTLSAAESLVVRSAAQPHREFLKHWVVKESLVKAGVCGLDGLAQVGDRRPDGLVTNEFVDEPGVVGACVAPAQTARRLAATPDHAAFISSAFLHPPLNGRSSVPVLG